MTCMALPAGDTPCAFAEAMIASVSSACRARTAAELKVIVTASSKRTRARLNDLGGGTA